jgi:hypothetical protein
MLFRISKPMHPKREGRHPLCACWAGRKRQSKHATPVCAVENERKAMATKHLQVAVGERGPEGLDKKPIGVQLN